MDELTPNLLRPQGMPPAFEPPPPRRSRRYFFIAVLILILVGYGVRRYTLAHWPNGPVVYDQVTLRPKKIGFLQTIKNFIFHNNNLLEGQADDRINILVLGIGGPGHDGPYLSDTNIIASLKPSTNEVALISIPRDLGVKIDEYGWRKINSADAFGEAAHPGEGGDYARKIFSKTFNLSIPYYVRVDFKAFEDMVNTVGGITVNVPNAFTDSQFPGPKDSYQTITFSAGAQTMMGEQALNYVRSRHGTNGQSSDFARSHRQQLILEALKEKMLSYGTYLNPAKIQSILSTLSNHVTTNLDFGQLMYLASLARDSKAPPKTLVLDNSLKGFLVSSTGDNGAFILSPKTGTFDEINNAMTNIFSPQIPNLVNTLASATTTPHTQVTAKVEIQNGTWRAGLAARYGKQLGEQGFSVIAVGNSLMRPLKKTGIFKLSATVPAEAMDQLVRMFNAPILTELPPWLKQTFDNPSTEESEQGMKYNNETDVLIILGEDTKE